MIQRRTLFTTISSIGALLLAAAVLGTAPAGAATSMQFASAWEGSPATGGVWVPSPTSSNVLGAPEGTSQCVAASSSPGGATATFDFSGFSIPGGDVIHGVELRMKYETEGDHDVQLTNVGALVGSEREIPANPGPSTCDGTAWTTAGGPLDTWGVAAGVLTPTKINNGDIGFKYSQRVQPIAGGDPGSLPVDIDAVALIIYHGPANTPPTADAGGPYGVAEGGTVGLSAASSTDAEQSTASLDFAWDLDNDGMFDDATGISPTFSAAGKDGPSAQTIKVRVTDAGALMDIAMGTVNITNVAPTILGVVPSSASINEGQSVTVTGSFSDPALALETYTGSATWSDGPVTALTIGAGTFSTVRPFPDDNPSGTPSDVFTVQILINDGDGGSDSATSPQITVNNVAPTVGPVSVSPATSDEGEMVTASASFTDPGVADSHTCIVNFGDGSGDMPGNVVGNSCSASYTYVDDDPTATPSDSYPVTVTVIDDDTGSGANATSHQVDNVAPTVGAVTVDIEPSDEGQAVVASAPFTDPGTADTHTCKVDYGDGSGPLDGTVAAGICTGPSHVYVDDDPTNTPSDSYTVTVAVTDDDTGNDANTGSHTVNNVAPTVGAVTVSPEPSDEGSAVTASADFTDPGVNDTFSCEVDYGDGEGLVPGTVSGVTCDGPSHIYADNGDYTVTIEVTDDDTGVGSNDGVHQVDNVDPTITASTNSAEECGDTPEGGLVEVSADFSDPGFDKAIAGTMEDFDASEIDWGDGFVEPATVVETPGGENVATTGTASGSHIYASGGIYTITVTVTDDDGGSDSVELIALVTGAGLNGGEVQVVGTDFKDVVNVKKKRGSIEVMAKFIGSRKVAFPLTDADNLRVLVCDGDDQVHVNQKLTLPAILEGDAGRDHLRAGNGPTLIEGGAGSDHLWGRNANDFLYGDDGDDFLYGGRGGDLLFGGPGDDKLFGQHDDDMLDGGAGVDDCKGGPGTDTNFNCEAGVPLASSEAPSTD